MKILFILLLGLGFSNVLDRYKTLKTQEVQLVNEQGSVILNLSELNADLENIEKILNSFNTELAYLKTKSSKMEEYASKNKDSHIQDLDSLFQKVNDFNIILSQKISKYYDSNRNDINSIKSQNIGTEIEIDNQKVRLNKIENQILQIESLLVNPELPAYPKEKKSIFNYLNYPKLAIEMKLEGKVFVKFYVDSNGEVRNNSIKMLRGNPVFEEAAIKAVSRSEWHPAVSVSGDYIGSWMTVPINFNLKDR